MLSAISCRDRKGCPVFDSHDAFFTEPRFSGFGESAILWKHLQVNIH